MEQIDLYTKLQQKYPKNFENCFDFSPPDGWNDLVERLTDMVIAIDPNIQIEQVKEKFCGLRYYVTTESTDAKFLIETAEDASERTCQVCGKDGKIVGDRWAVCLCPEHGDY